MYKIDKLWIRYLYQANSFNLKKKFVFAASSYCMPFALVAKYAIIQDNSIMGCVPSAPKLFINQCEVS